MLSAKKSLYALFAFALIIPFQNCGRPFEPLTQDLSSQQDGQSQEDVVLKHGQALYNKNCMACHGSLLESAKTNRSAAQISAAFNNISQMSFLKGVLKTSEVQALAVALERKVEGNPFVCATDRTPSADPLRRLSREEYQNTIADLFNGAVALSELQTQLNLFPQDTGDDGNPFDRGVRTVTSGIFNAHNSITDRIGSIIGSDATKRGRIFTNTCFATVPATDGCVTDFIQRFGKQVLRRPVDEAERTLLLRAYRIGDSAGESAKFLIRALLLSPSFLYHTEFKGTPVSGSNSLYELSSYELAARLSYLVTGSIPDAVLMAKADDQSLLQPEVLAQEATRLLGSTKAKASFRRFFKKYLVLDTLKAPAYSANFREAISLANLNEDAVEEMLSFTDYISLGNRPLAEILTSRVSFLKSNNLAAIYGVAAGSAQLPSTPAEPVGEKVMNYNPITRRYFLQGLGSSIVSLPFLVSLTKEAHAQQNLAAKRFITIGQDNGFYTPHWLPPTANKSRLTVNGTHREMRLTDVAGPQAGAISNILGPEFSALRSKLLLLENLDTVCPWARGHQMATILCGNFGRVWSDAKYRGPSIDRVMARSSKIYPTPARIDGLHLRVEQNGSEPEIDLSWDYRNGEMVFPTVFDQPQAAFDAIFNTASTGDAAAIQKEYLLVDQVKEQFKLLRNNARTSASDKKVLDEHMEMIFDLQKRITASAPTCSPGTRPGRQYKNWSPADRGELIDLFSQILVAAIKCGTTRIATLGICRGVDDLNYNSVVGINLPHGWHSQSHVDYSSAEVLKIYQFYSRKVASLLTALNVEEPGTGGTYLDNSIVLYGNGQSEGDHRYSNRPILIAGGGAGAIQMNKYIDYGGYNNARAPYGPAFVGRNYNQLLVTLLQAMGLTESDYFTADMSARGILPGFGDDRAVANYKSDRRNPLPGVLKAG